MKKLCTIALCSLAALGVAAGQACAGHLFSHLHRHCCDQKYTVVCKPYNAFSPPCCVPCGHWHCNMMPFSPYGPPDCYGGHCLAAPGMVPSGPMPPAAAPPGYMPPAPAEVDGAPQTQMLPTPMLPYALPTSWMPPPGIHPGAIGYYPNVMPTAMPAYGMPQGMLPAYWMAPQ
jgi:hypothetical protein